MKHYSIKELMALLGVSHVALIKALKNIHYELRSVEGSSKRVKFYSLEDLPERYRKKIGEIDNQEPTEVGGTSEADIETKSENKTLFTKKYFLADPKKRDLANDKVELVKMYLNRKKVGGLNRRQWLEEIMSSYPFVELEYVTIKQLNDWVTKYRESRAKGTNIVEVFIDGRGNKRFSTKLNEDMQKIAIAHFTRKAVFKLKNIYLNMCHQFGGAMPSYSALRNFHKNWEKLNPQLAMFARSPDEWKNKCMASFGDASERAKYRNHYWELDSTPADVICSDGKRYAVLCAIDVYSRRCEFIVSESSNSYSIALLLRKAILKLGIPENVVIDNGKDYRSNHFASICSGLGINMEVVPPFSGDKKGFVERVFRRYTEQLFEDITGFIGHNITQKMQLQARKSFGSKMMSKMQHTEEIKAKTDEEKKAIRDAWKIKKENLGIEIGVLKSPAELEATIDGFNQKLYEQTIHGGIKTTPMKRWNDSTIPVKSISDVRMLDLLLGESVERSVNKKGINFDGAQYTALELIAHMHTRVQCLVPTDYGKLLVYAEDMSFICEAIDSDKLGKNRYIDRAAKKKSIALSRKLDSVVKELEKIKLSNVEDRMNDAVIEVEANTVAVTKQTPIIEAVMRGSQIQEDRDKKTLEEIGLETKFDFSKKDEDNKPVKLMPNGRRRFTSYIERFVWDLENGKVDDSTNKLAEKYPELWEAANRKVG